MIVDGINVKIKCDICGKFHSDSFWGKDSALKLSRMDGWYITNTRHLCPECKNLNSQIDYVKNRTYK